MSDRCWMVRVPKIVLVYVYAMGGAAGYREKANYFVRSYLENPPGFEHETRVVCNGIGVNSDAEALFKDLPNCSFMNHDDSGWDIGAYQLAAKHVPADLMIFCGGHTYFRKPGWLLRIWEVFEAHGYALYGATGNQGARGSGVHPHVRTTGFWCPPKLLNAYPYQVTQPGGGGQRYEMEHGQTCLSNWAQSQQIQRLIVGWHHVLPLEQCDSMPNGYHQGDQSNVLIGDRMTAPPFHHSP